MKKIILLFVMLNIFQNFSNAQTNSGVSTYWAIFRNKNNSPYSINNPSEYLSEKSIERRKIQNIAITTNDLPVNPNYINGVKNTGVTITGKSKWFNAVLFSTNDLAKINQIKALPFVKEVQLLSSPSTQKAVDKFEVEKKSVTKDEEINKTPTEKIPTYYNYGAAYLQAHQIGMDCLHDIGFHGEGMTMAYMDDGFYYVDTISVFDSLRVNNQILGGWNYVLGNNNLYEHQDNTLTHGMNTLSCSGGNLPGVMVGTAPKAKFWLFVTENTASESWQEETNWAEAAEFADSVGVQVINTSLGYSIHMTDSTQNYTYADMNGRTTIISIAATLAARKGMFVCVSAGNSGGAPWYKITAPGDADSILTVGAVDSLGVLADFSSRGPTADGRIKPNTCARGVAAAVASPNGGTELESGTSFSSPITAGAVACLWQAHPTATNQQLIKAIQQSANQYYFPDTLQGYGIPNFCFANTILADMLGIAAIPSIDESLTIYPNPFTSDFTISFYSNKKETVQIELLDITGRRIFEQERIVNPSDNTFSIEDETDISKGIYILRLITSEKVYYKKVVKE